MSDKDNKYDDINNIDIEEIDYDHNDKLDHDNHMKMINQKIKRSMRQFATSVEGQRARRGKWYVF